MTVRSRDLPRSSRLLDHLDRPTWVDCWEAPVSRTDLSAVELHRAMMSAMPRWVDPAMRLRDGLVRLVGVRPVGVFARSPSPPAPQPGERLGIFTVRAVAPDEIVMGDDDRHLDFRLAVHRYDQDGPKMVVAMALRTHNLLGRLYMVPVGPIHRHLVRAMLARAVATRAI